MPQIVFIPKDPEESEIFQKRFIEGKRVYVDDKMHYIYSNPSSLNIAIFPDRTGAFERDSGRISKITKDVTKELDNEGFVLSSRDSRLVKTAAEASRQNPVVIIIEKGIRLAKQ
jgi:hypothetical protein